MELFFEQRIDRREFLKKCIWQGTSLALSIKLLKNAYAQDLKFGYTNSYPALHWQALTKGNIKCQLCPRECIVKPGMRGFCRVRENRDGKYFTLTFGNPCSVHIDPIEKKPFFHLLPGTTAFSLATAGCNFTCKHCQNWEISQKSPEETENMILSPQAIIDLTKKYRCPSIAYTYTEPVIFYEYMLAIAKRAKKEGILNVMHSNGYINQKPLEELCPYLDGADIDLKAFTDEFYTSITSGTLGPVLETLKTLKKKGVHLEITNLIIPTKNDNITEIKKMCEWIATNLGKDVPLHLSRFYPMYRLNNLSPTPTETLKRAYEIAKNVGLEYVYIGNLPGLPEENTYCPACKKLLIERIGYTVKVINLKDGRCKFCGHPIPGLWAC